MKGKALAAGVLMFSLAFSTVAYADDGMTDIERKWIDLQKAVTDRMVKEGKLKQEDADSRIASLNTELSKPGDSVYERFSERCGSKKSCKADREDMLAKDYAKLTGRSLDEIKKACQDAGITVWQLAEKEGKLDSFKSSVLTGLTTRLDEMVKQGKLTAQQRDEKLRQIQDKFGKMS